MRRVVVDVGNSRLKWGRVGPSGSIEASLSLPLDTPEAWEGAWSSWDLDGPDAASWGIATVNPPAASRFEEFLRAHGSRDVDWYRSAADVPLKHALGRAETAGADRAFAVAAASALHPAGGSGLIVSCGTATTVDRIATDGIWQGGAIAPGLHLSARALHLLTALLPEVDVAEAPAPWGSSTVPALSAGIFWGVVGSIRELLARQAADLSPAPWILFTGGDAGLLAPWVIGEDAKVVPDLVLQGLAQVSRGPLAP